MSGGPSGCWITTPKYSRILPRDCSAARSEKASDAIDAMLLENMDLGVWERWGRAPRRWQRHQLFEISECSGFEGRDGVVMQANELGAGIGKCGVG